MKHRILGVILFGLAASASLTACAPNPADDVPAAVEPAADVPADAAPATDPTEAAPDSAAAPADASAAALPAGEFPLSGSIMFTASKVTRSHDVVFKTWNGTYKSDGTVAGTALNFAVELASLDVDQGQTPMLQDHLLSADFFDVAVYPQAVFTSSSFAEGVDATIFANAEGATHTVTGTLDIHGKQKEVSFPITLSDDGAGTLSAKTEFSVNRQDFAITYPGKADDLVRDEVVIKVDASMATTG